MAWDGIDELGPSPTDVVLGYMRARSEWELDTMERTTGWRRGEDVDPWALPSPDERALEAAWTSLRLLREQWCAPGVIYLLDPHLPFGNVPDADPGTARVVSVQIVGSEAIVTMSERQDPGSDLTEIVAYTLARDHGAWKLTDRSMQLPSGGRLHNLL
jgi:hypothetical protein